MTALNRLILTSVVLWAPMTHAADIDPAGLAKQIKQSTAQLVDQLTVQERLIEKQKKELGRLEKQLTTEQERLTAEKARSDTLKTEHATALLASKQALSAADARATDAEKALRASTKEQQALERKLARQDPAPAAPAPVVAKEMPTTDSRSVVEPTAAETGITGTSTPLDTPMEVTPKKVTPINVTPKAVAPLAIAPTGVTQIETTPIAPAVKSAIDGQSVAPAAEVQMTAQVIPKPKSKMVQTTKAPMSDTVETPKKPVVPNPE